MPYHCCSTHPTHDRAERIDDDRSTLIHHLNNACACDSSSNGLFTVLIGRRAALSLVVDDDHRTRKQEI